MSTKLKPGVVANHIASATNVDPKQVRAVMTELANMASSMAEHGDRIDLSPDVSLVFREARGAEAGTPGHVLLKTRV